MEKLFLGISSHVVCIDKKTGEEIWKTKVKSTSSITNVFYEENIVFAYSGGHLFSINASNGEVNWSNPLKGLGYGACIIASEQQSSAVVASQLATQQASAAVATASIAATAGSS